MLPSFRFLAFKFLEREFRDSATPSLGEIPALGKFVPSLRLGCSVLERHAPVLGHRQWLLDGVRFASAALHLASSCIIRSPSSRPKGSSAEWSGSCCQVTRLF